MRIVSWIARIILFLILLGFAISNTQETELRFFGSELAWTKPLVLHLLMFFVGGAVVTVLAMLPGSFRQRREISRLRREVSTLQRPVVVTGNPATETPNLHLPIH